MRLSEQDSLLPLGLVTRITGSRVERWRHNLYDVWAVDKVELAILAELLLRGPQSEGELRTRAGRMDPIDSIEILRAKDDRFIGPFTIAQVTSVVIVAAGIAVLSAWKNTPHVAPGPYLAPDAPTTVRGTGEVAA